MVACHGPSLDRRTRRHHRIVTASSRVCALIPAQFATGRSRRRRNAVGAHLHAASVAEFEWRQITEPEARSQFTRRSKARTTQPDAKGLSAPGQVAIYSSRPIEQEASD